MRFTKNPGGRWHKASDRIGTKEVVCAAPKCAERRVHHEQPDTPRGPQCVRVRANYIGPAFCSITCKMYYEGMMKEKGNEEIY